MYAVHVDAKDTTRLMELIALGLYHHHAGEPLNERYDATARIFAPQGEAAVLKMIEEESPADAPRVGGNFGDTTFVNEAFSTRT